MSPNLKVKWFAISHWVGLINIMLGIGEHELRVDDVFDFIKEKLPERQMLLKPFLEARSINMIHAWRGIGKTHIGLGMATAQVTGGVFLKWKADQPSKVLYVDGEMAGEMIQQWMKESLHRKGLPPLEPGWFNLIAADRQEQGIPSLLIPDNQKRIEDKIGDAKTIYFDNISTLFRGSDENEGQDWEIAQEWLLSLRRKGISSELMHHDGKAGQQRGTSKREDVMNTVLQLKRPKDYKMSQGLRCEVHFDKARSLYGLEAEPFETQLITNPQGNSYWEIKPIQEAQVQKAKELSAEGLSTRDIAKQTGKSKSWVAEVVKKGTPETEDPEQK
ncbi:MAG TPA: AAA family ATPase [Candidatus Sulfotelmatobacter sp.]|nr:AAA family ATPase [Candidatus Sulfotelmatobacter sp.]